MFSVILMYAFLASVFPLGRISLGYASPIFLTGIRMVLGGGLLIVFQYWHDRSKCFVSRAYFGPLAVLTIFNIYLTNVPEFWGLQYLTAAKACFIYNLSPFAVALFSYYFFNERMTLKKWIGIAIGFLGFLPILLAESPGEKNIQHVFFLSFAEIALLTAALSTAYGWVIMRKLVRQGSYSPIMANGVSMVFGGILALITSRFVEDWYPVPIFHFWPFVVVMLLIMVISNIIGYNIYGVLLRSYTATFLSLASSIAPLFAALYGWVLLGESVSFHFYFSAVVVLIGLFIFYSEELRQGNMHKPHF